jgi:hypothetical protein
MLAQSGIAADDRQDSPNLLLDVQMLVMLGGRERTEVRGLFAAAGLEGRRCTLFECVPT